MPGGYWYLHTLDTSGHVFHNVCPRSFNPFEPAPPALKGFRMLGGGFCVMWQAAIVSFLLAAETVMGARRTRTLGTVVYHSFTQICSPLAPRPTHRESAYLHADGANGLKQN